jgi:cytochrome c5
MFKHILSIFGCAAIALLVPAHAQNVQRSGEQIVKSQCAKCHEAGLYGAPKIGDRAAWAPRMKLGLDATVRSAMNGHGAMPARGGMASLSDAELRNAILYMFYPAGEALRKLPAASPAAPDPHHKTVAGMDVYLGIVLAEAAGLKQRPPSGKDYYYVNISLLDRATGAPIKDAQVEARAANSVSGGESHKLEPSDLADVSGYGSVFRMQGAEPYTIAVQIRRPGSALPAETHFEFKP